MQKRQEVILNSLNIIRQSLAPMLRMRGWSRGWRSYSIFYIYRTASSSNAEDERMEEGL
jgi:hypothetical protein